MLSSPEPLSCRHEELQVVLQVAQLVMWAFCCSLGTHQVLLPLLLLLLMPVLAVRLLLLQDTQLHNLTERIKYYS